MDSWREVWIAQTRFGLGPRPGDAPIGDPRGWLRDQLRPLPDGVLPGDALPDSASIIAEGWRRREEGRRSADPQQAKKEQQRWARATYERECRARIARAAATDQPFPERLARLWSDHFTVSILRHQILPVAGAFEREAIRPHALGRFRDMLRAVIRHPAMIGYLDNQNSVSPDSPAARSGKPRGLNENLAREILELHTLGVDGGYTQADVEGLARLLTGWGFDNRTGEFRFDLRRHAPGPHALLGRTYGDGADEVERALDDLALHPATARRAARRLAAHFVADDPPASAVDALADTFTATGGDLRAVAEALIALPEAWAAAPTYGDPGKLRCPEDWLIAALRLLGADPDREDRRDDRARADARSGKALSALPRRMGQPPFSAPSPAGWPDLAAAWASPEQILQRIEAAHTLAPLARARPEVVAEALGPALPAEARRIILGAPDARQGIALLLLSPALQRR